VRPQLPYHGAADECAERLLLHEHGLRTPQELLRAAGVIVVKQRLAAVGFPSEGLPLESAQRLLFLLENVPLETLMRWDAKAALEPPNCRRVKRARHGRKIRRKTILDPADELLPEQALPEVIVKVSHLAVIQTRWSWGMSAPRILLQVWRSMPFWWCSSSPIPL
jgi:hypothetical protein